jgi:hypothetical protein
MNLSAGDQNVRYMEVGKLGVSEKVVNFSTSDNEHSGKFVILELLVRAHDLSLDAI